MQSDRRTPNRLKPTLLQWINPMWWADDAERNTRWPRWRWFLRNPFCNFLSVIVGVADCYRTVHYSRSPWTFAQDGGINYGYTMIDGGICPLPFISYRGSVMECGIGWKTSGGFGISCRRANSPNAEPT